MDKRKEIQEALEIYKRRTVLGIDGQAEAIDTLVGHGLWSRRQIESITGAGTHAVRSRMTKADHSGGRFNPDTLRLILALYEATDRGEDGAAEIDMIVALGTSTLMLSRLSGIKEPAIKYRKSRVDRA